MGGEGEKHTSPAEPFGAGFGLFLFLGCLHPTISSEKGVA